VQAVVKARPAPIDFSVRVQCAWGRRGMSVECA
jgi:hypothetical protein